MSTEAESSAFLENILVQEYLRVCADVRSLEANGDKLISIAITVFGLAATVGLEKKISLVFIALPAAILAVVAYSIMLYVWIFSLCGYKLHLEDIINQRAGHHILLWSALVPKRESINIARVILILIYVFALVGLVALSIIEVRASYPQWVSWTLMGFSLAAILALVPAWRQRGKIKGIVYDASQRLYAARSIATTPGQFAGMK